MKKIFLVFVIVFLLFITLQINCFATVPEGLPDFSDFGYEYWVICTEESGRFVCYATRNPIVVTVDETQLMIEGSYHYYVYTSDGKWVNREAGGGISYKYFDTIYSANHDIVYEDGSGFYRREDFWANVNIVMPRNGFVDNIDVFSISVITDFTRHLTDYEIEKLRVEVELNGGPVEGEAEVIYNKMSKTALYSVNELSFYVEVPPGENELRVVYYYEDVMLGSDSVTFTRLIGFIDEDGDGFDDRTGQPYVPEKPEEVVDIEKPQKPEGGTAIDWLKYLGEYVGYIFEVLLNSISNFAKNVVSGVGSVLSLAEPMFNFVSQFFSSMPLEIRTGIMAMFSVSVFLVIMKMVRG